jgi:peptidase E
MIKYILVGGYIHKAKDEGRAFCEELIKGINKKPVKILDCMFARSQDSWEKKIKEDYVLFSKFIKNFDLELADPLKFTEQVKNSDVIFLRGGYTQVLFKLLNKDTSWIKELDGKVLAGTSAGAEVIAKYYHVLSTNRIGDGLGLLSIKVVPHWNSDYSDETVKNINWDKTLKELKEYKEDLPIYALKEGEFIIINQ